MGTQDGELSVNANGAATYTMELEVPPGTHGVQPKLSIWYSSQSGNGLLGHGFVLQGLSSITRCQASLKLDGYNGGVGFDANDRFCLDGQRLVKVAGSGAYGAEGSVYHTENETWTEVTAAGTCGSGPCSFVAKNKDGWTLDFGTGDSGVPLASGGTIAAWQIDSSTDLNGNRISVSYDFEASTLQNLPVEISYTENAAVGIAATRKVTFEYEPRAQKIPRYAGGQLFELTDRLKTIRTWLDGAEILAYFLSYEISTGTQRDLLTSLQKCTAQRECYPATTFTHQKQTNTLTAAGSGDGTLITGWCTESNALIGWADFNGDGLPDAHCDTTTGVHRVLLSTGTDLRSPNGNPDGQIKTGWCSGSGFTPSWIDFNGDAKADLACDGTDGSHRVLLSNGESLKGAGSNTDGLLQSGWCGGGDVRWGNFDGDGRADLLCSDGGYLKVLVSTGTDLESPPNNEADDRVFDSAWCTSSGATILWADFNGDRMSDARCSTTSGTHQVLVSTGTLLVSPVSDRSGTVKTSWCAGSDRRIGAADFNGDGLLDWTCDSSDGAHWVQLSTGETLVTPKEGTSDGRLTTPSSWCSGSAAAVEWSDFNGDGFSDLQCSDGNGRIMALLSTGSDVRAPGSSGDGVLFTNWCKSGRTQWTDFDADSLGDVTCSVSGAQQVLLHTPGAADLASRITDGMGKTIDLTYSALTEEDVYSSGAATTYPTVAVRSPLYVTSRYVLGDGRGAQYAFRYSYKGARTDVEEHRWMGFEQVAFTQEATGRQNVTNYAQEYPLISFVTSSTVLDSGGRTLASSTFTPLMRNPFENVWEVLVASETSSTYTNGKPDYTETKSYGYDDCGNLKSVADVASPYFEVHTCFKYVNTTSPWRMGYPLEQKSTRTAEACSDFLATSTTAWNAATDLRWSRTEYDDRMNIVAAKVWDDGNGAFLTTRRTFNGAGGILTETDPSGDLTSYTWDDTLTYPVQQLSPPLSDGRQLKASATFHRAFGVPATITDPNGNVHATSIDGFGRLSELRGPDPASSSGAASVLLEKYTYAQDTTGRYMETRRRQSWDEGDSTNWFYSRNYHDGLLRTFLTRARSARSGVDVLQSTFFDTAGREWKKAVPYYSNSTPAYTVTTYDLLDRPLTVTQPDGTVSRTEYLQGAIQVRTTAAYGTDIARTTTDTNDPRGFTLKSIAPNGAVTVAAYDPLGQPLTLIYPTGRTTTTTWDSVGRPTTSVDGNSGTTTRHYGTDGRLRSTTNGAGGVVTLEYDSLDRVVVRRLTPAEGTAEVYTLGYDDRAVANAQGRLTSVSTSSFVEQYAYSSYGLVTLEQLSIDGSVYVDKADYDPAGQVSLRTFADGTQLRTTRFVDGTLNQLDYNEGSGTFVNAATYVSYDSLQQPETLLYGNGLRTDNTYYQVTQGMARLQSTTVARQTGDGTAILTRTYGWNQLDELTSVQKTRAGQAVTGEIFVHDDMGWVTSASGPYGNLGYTYDLAGNLTSLSGATYTLVSSTDRLKDATNGTVFTYDGAGNLSRKKSGASDWQYRHDAASRLSSVLLNDALRASHLYDSGDQRIRREDGSGNVSIYLARDIDVHRSGGTALLTKYVRGVNGPLAAITTTYAASSLSSVARRQQLLLDPERYDVRSLPGAAAWLGATLRAWVHRAPAAAVPTALTLFLLPAGLLLRRTPFARLHPLFSALVPLVVAALLLTSGPALQAELGAGGGYPVTGTLYFQGDQVSSTILVTAADGAETTSIGWTPYGSIDEANSSGPDDFRPKFGSKERDDETGLDYFGARYYDSGIGRFLEPDPERQFASAYAYGGNDPVSMIDPDGRFAVLVAAAAVGLGASLGAYFGGVALNHNHYNPAQWNWSDGRTYAGVFAGAAIGAATGALGAAAAETAGPAAGIAADIVLSAGENASFTALGGGSKQELAQAAVIGAVSAAAMAGAVAGISGALALAARSGSRMARRGTSEALDGVEPDDADLLEQTCASFPAGEMVLMADGTMRPIEAVRAGNEVEGLEIEHDRRGEYGVMATVSRAANRLTRVTTGDGAVIATTPTHGFRTMEHGWVAASQLRADMRLVDDGGSAVPIRSVETRALQAPVPVFNFSVDRAEDYYVSPARVLVHNVWDPCMAARVAKGRRPGFRKSTRETVIGRQGAGTGMMRSAISDTVMPIDAKISFGPTQTSAWNLDHITTWAALLDAMQRTKKVVTWKQATAIFNYTDNLRYITREENVSHAHEPTPADDRKGAIRILRDHHLWLR